MHTHAHMCTHTCTHMHTHAHTCTGRRAQAGSKALHRTAQAVAGTHFVTLSTESQLAPRYWSNLLSEGRITLKTNRETQTHATASSSAAAEEREPLAVEVDPIYYVRTSRSRIAWAHFWDQRTSPRVSDQQPSKRPLAGPLANRHQEAQASMLVRQPVASSRRCVDEANADD
jgi:hypothetical protein